MKWHHHTRKFSSTFSQLQYPRHHPKNPSLRSSNPPQTFIRTTPSKKLSLLQRSHSTINNPPPHENVYIPEVDLEDFEDYRIGGYHPTIIGDTFQTGRYEIVHKLGFGGYSTIWLARDKSSQKYVSLKILTADESLASNESGILQFLNRGESRHMGRQFIPCLLDEFAFDGPNGRHVCLVMEPACCSVAASKEDSVDLMFPVETARSIAAQLVLGVFYLHSRGVCHGDLHTRNFLLYGLSLDHLSPSNLYKRYRLDKAPITRVDKAPVEPHAPPYAVYPMHIKTPASKLLNPVIKISDYGTSFQTSTSPTPKLHTPALYLPPEDFFNEPVTLAADIWTLGLALYEVLGERCLFETYGWDRDDIMADMVSTLGRPPDRWWNARKNRGEFFEEDGSWVSDIERIYSPVSRPLRRRMWDMGRGEIPETCEWDVEGGEMRDLEVMLRGMLGYEPGDRWTANEVLRSEYMVKWVLPAWERQQDRLRKGVTVSRNAGGHG